MYANPISNYCHARAKLAAQTGFTLIELMVVIGIVALLARFALPVYTTYMVRAAGAAGPALLGEYQARMNRCYQDSETYIGCCPADFTQNNFTVTCSNGSPAVATNFTLTATGTSSSRANGFVYTVNQSNTKSTTWPSVLGSLPSACSTDWC